MRHSESIAKLAPALHAALAEVENATKNAVNPHFKNKYADLAEIIDTTKPVLTKHGLTVVQLPGFEGGAVTLESVLVHESGEWLSGVAGSPVTKADPQGVGSAITYLRRYSLAALCGIAQEDDDARSAARAPSANGGAKAAKKVSDEQVRTLSDLIDETETDKVKMLSHYGIANLGDLPAVKFGEAVAMLERKRAVAA